MVQLTNSTQIPLYSETGQLLAVGSAGLSVAEATVGRLSINNENNNITSHSTDNADYWTDYVGLVSLISANGSQITLTEGSYVVLRIVSAPSNIAFPVVWALQGICDPGAWALMYDNARNFSCAGCYNATKGPHTYTNYTFEIPIQGLTPGSNNFFVHVAFQFLEGASNATFDMIAVLGTNMTTPTPVTTTPTTIPTTGNGTTGYSSITGGGQESNSMTSGVTTEDTSHILQMMWLLFVLVFSLY